MSELLDRFRPAGSPGASTAAGAPIADVPDVELADVHAALRSLEAEAAVVVDAGRGRAAELREEATSRAQALVASTPEACAAARAEARTQRRRGLESSLAAVASKADRETEQIRASAVAHTDEIVNAVLAGVRASASPSGRASAQASPTPESPAPKRSI